MGKMMVKWVYTTKQSLLVGVALRERRKRDNEEEGERGERVGLCNARCPVSSLWPYLPKYTPTSILRPHLHDLMLDGTPTLYFPYIKRHSHASKVCPKDIKIPHHILTSVLHYKYITLPYYAHEIPKNGLFQKKITLILNFFHISSPKISKESSISQYFLSIRYAIKSPSHELCDFKQQFLLIQMELESKQNAFGKILKSLSNGS